MDLKHLVFLVLFIFEETSGQRNSTIPPQQVLGSATTKVRQEKNVTIVDLDETDSDALIMKWTEQAISGVMAAIASKKLKYLTEGEKKQLEKCSKDADSIEKHASCVLPVLHASKHRPEPSSKHMTKEEHQKQVKNLIPKKFDTTNSEERKSETKPKKSSRFQSLRYKPNRRRYGKAKVLNFSSMKSTERFRKHEFTVNAKAILKRKQNPIKVKKVKTNQIGSFVLGPQDRKKRSSRMVTRSLDSYHLHPSQRRLTPIGSLAKFLMASVMKEKNKTMEDRVPWQQLIEKARYTGARRKELKKRYRLKDNMDPLEEMAFKALENRNMLPKDFDNIIEKLQKNPEFRASEIKKAEKNPVKKVMGLMREGLKLGYMAVGKNVSGFDEKTMKVMSPRLFSVLPEDKGDSGEDDDPLDILSPSLLSLHSEGEGLEKELSIPNLVKAFTAADQQAWLDLIFEASGVQDALKEAEKAILEEEFQLKRKRRYAEKMRNEKGEPLYLTEETSVQALGPLQKKLINVSNEVTKSYTPEQVHEMELSGYAVMTKAQMKLMYGPGSPHANPELLKRFLAMNDTEIHRQIEKDIVALAERRSIRKKRAIVLSPLAGAAVIFNPALVSQPIILSPIIFSVGVGSPAALGPIILGPWMFLPLILSPRVLSPAILNPFMFVPIVLSPVALHPIILCPGLFNTIILTPLALSPFILSPQVFTPVILSPLVLSPFILSPTVGSPVILSPFVLTPVIYSPLALFALVLSPNALSPLIESKLFLAEVILSPSWLS